MMVRQANVLQSLEQLLNTGATGTKTDAQLLEQFTTATGPTAEAAFAALVGRHGPMVLRVCRQSLRDPHDAQDAFQNTFLVLARKASRLRERDLLGNWLHGVAHRIALKMKVSASRRHRHEEGAKRQPHAETGHVDDLGLLLHQEIRRLPEPLRKPIVLFYLQGLSYHQTACQLQLTEGTVRGRLARARERLRVRLQLQGVSQPIESILPPVGTAAVVPTSLLRAVVNAATTITANRATALSRALILASLLKEGVQKAMLAPRLKSITLVLLASGLLGTGGAGSVTGGEQEQGEVYALGRGSVHMRKVRSAVPDANPPDTPAIEAKLDAKLDFELTYQKQPLSDFVSFLAQKTGVRIIIDPSVILNKNEPLTIKPEFNGPNGTSVTADAITFSRGIGTLRSALVIVLKPLGLWYQVDGESVRIIRPKHVTVYVPMFRSEYFDRRTRLAMTELLIKEIERSTPYKVVGNLEDADLILEGPRIFEKMKTTVNEKPDVFEGIRIFEKVKTQDSEGID